MQAGRTEAEEVQQQQRMAVMERMTRKRRAKGQNVCAKQLVIHIKTWLHPEWEDTAHDWLCEKEKHGEEKRGEEPQKLGSRMIPSVEGAGFLHRITKPAAWRGGLQVLEDLEGDVKPTRRCEEKKKEWAKHWQCDSEAQWRISRGGMKRKETIIGVGCNGFHFKFPPDLPKEAMGEIVKILEKLGQCGRWPQQASTTMVFLIPKNVTSEQPTALLPSDSVVGAVACD